MKQAPTTHLTEYCVAATALLLVCCGYQSSTHSSISFEAYGGSPLAEKPLVRGVCRTFRTEMPAPPARFGAMIAPCGDLDGDGSQEIAASYITRTRDEKFVDIINFKSKSVLRTIAVPDCDFEGDGAVLASMRTDEAAELVIVTPSKAMLVVSGRSEPQRLQAYSLSTGVKTLDFKLAGDWVSAFNIRIVGIIDSPKVKGNRICVLSCSGKSIIAMSMSDGSIAYEVPAPSSVELTGKYMEPKGRVCGDLDSDGTQDYVIAYQDTGILQAYSGVDGHLLIKTQLGGSDAKARYALNLYYSRNLSGDGRNNIIVGTPYENRGVVRVIDLNSGEVRSEWSSSDRVERMGSALTVVPDIDGDSRPEIIVAGMEEEKSPEDIPPGILKLILSKSPANPIELAPAGELGQFGRALCPLDHDDRQATLDLLVGAPGGLSSNAASMIGSIWMLSIDKHGM